MGKEGVLDKGTVCAKAWRRESECYLGEVLGGREAADLA